LDENGCEALLGRGDLLFKCPGKKSLIRAQSPFISNQDMDNVLTYLKQMGGDPNYNPTFLDLKVKEEEPDAGQGKSSDDLYQDVKDYVMITGICSRSALMRNFSLSYSKVDQMILSLRNEGVIQAIQGGKNIVVMRKNVEA
jgi:S-DNA-T family DNA segregation ATPase FtsK/SpoIIIE